MSYHGTLINIYLKKPFHRHPWSIEPRFGLKPQSASTENLLFTFIPQRNVMFVPKTASSLRNPRRRQRTSSGESTKQHRAKRQRSVQEDAEQFGDDGIESDGRRESSGFQPPGATDQAKSEISEEAGPQKQIAIRGPKKFEKQGGYNDIDGAVVLVRFIYTFFSISSLII